MKTVGKLIKEARVRKRLSLKKVEAATKIKSEFIEAVEKEDWMALPDFSVVAGFVKNLASFLGIDERVALAVLRRDYPPKEVSVNPKQDIDNRFIVRPRLAFMAGVVLVILALLAYLGFEYLRFVSPPSLSVREPKEGEVVSEKSLLVLGKTDTDATVSVNNQPAIVDADGNFSTTINISENTKEVDIKAKSRSGRETVVKRNIKPELK